VGEDPLRLVSTVSLALALKVVTETAEQGLRERV
jgi:hypothetical protein